MWTKPKPNYCRASGCHEIAPAGCSLCPKCKERQEAELRARGESIPPDYQKGGQKKAEAETAQVLRKIEAEIQFETNTSGYYNISSIVAMTGLCDATIWKHTKTLNVDYKVVKHNALFSEEVVELIGSEKKDGARVCYSDGRLFITTGKLAEHMDCMGSRQINKLGKDGRWARFTMSGMVWNEAHGFADYLVATRHPEAADQLHQDIERLCPRIDDPVTSGHPSGLPQPQAGELQSNVSDNEGKNRPGRLSWLDY